MVTFDTNEKYAEVKVGGKVMENISSVSFSKRMPMEYGMDESEEDVFSCYISQHSEEKDGMTQCTHIYASQNTGGEFIPVKQETELVCAEIREFLKNQVK